MAIDTHGVKGKPWVGFDLDGTLATYDHWRGIQHIGEPVKPMCDLIKKLREEGKAVKIMTARVAPKGGDGIVAVVARAFIAKWCKDNLGFVPPITHEKDSLMETLYDDRVKAVEQNTGKVLNMAKFKVGDRVKDKRGNIGIVVGIQDDDAGPFGPPPSKYGAILRIKTDDGKTGYLEEANASLANSILSRNAKFTKGQKVVLTPSGLSYHGKNLEGVVGVIEGEYDDGEYKGLFLPAYWIGGELGRRLPKAMEGSKDVSRRVSEENIRLANAVRSRNAKFKVGDRFAPKDDLGMTLVVKKIVKHPTWGVVYAVDARGENWYTEDEMVARNTRACNSTNPVVAKALNASRVAVNANTTDAATAKRDIEQSLRKMAEFAAKFTGAKAVFAPTHSDYNWAGHIDLMFSTDEDADGFNPYYLIGKLSDNKSLLPKWAWGVSGFNYDQTGRKWRINIGRFGT